MKFVYILEDDTKFQKELAESISAIDPLIQSRFFNSLSELFEWFKTFSSEGRPAIAKGGKTHTYVHQELSFATDDNQIALIMFKEGMINHTHLKMVAKIQKALLERQACPLDTPTSMVLTAFDNPDFDIKKYMDPILSNIIFKPFDKLILQQHLIYALEGHKAPAENTLVNQQTTAVVELLKDIQLEAISDVGFLTSSDRPIEVGSICKYYGQMFTSSRHRSVMAVCQHCLPHPKNPGNYLAVFYFYALDQLQITNLRKFSRAKEAKPYDYKWAPFSKTSMPEIHIACIDEDENNQPTFINKVEQMFTGVKLYKYKSFGALMADIDPAHALAEGGSQRSPSFHGFETVKLTFDSTGHTYLGLETDTKKEISSLFSLSLGDLKNKYDWMASFLSKEHKEKYRKYCHSGVVLDDGILNLMVGEHSFPIRVVDVRKDGGKLHFTVRELNSEETLNFLKANSKISKGLHLIVSSHHWCSEGSLEKWEQLKASVETRFQLRPKVVMTSKEEFNDKQEQAFSKHIDDIFYKPIDPVYLMQKIKLFYPAVSERVERVKFSTVECDLTIKTVNQVKITEISEAGFVMEYYRPLPVGSFREIILWKPNELEAPELLATCNFVEESESKEKDKSKTIYKCHFVFFGSTDAFLKHIRLWIMENYVQSKEAKAS